jgi:hypothetical protein
MPHSGPPVSQNGTARNDGREFKGIILQKTLSVTVPGLPKPSAVISLHNLPAHSRPTGGSPAGATLPEVAKFPLRNKATSAAAAVKLMVKDTKPKAFSP